MLKNYVFIILLTLSFAGRAQQDGPGLAGKARISVQQAASLTGRPITSEVDCSSISGPLLSRMLNSKVCNDLWTKMGAQIFAVDRVLLYVIQNGQEIAAMPQFFGLVADLDRDSNYELIYVDDLCGTHSCPTVRIAPRKTILNAEFPRRIVPDFDSLEFVQMDNSSVHIKLNGKLVGVLHHAASGVYEINWRGRSKKGR
jgi:hypothetical protein